MRERLMRKSMVQCYISRFLFWFCIIVLAKACPDESCWRLVTFNQEESTNQSAQKVRLMNNIVMIEYYGDSKCFENKLRTFLPSSQIESDPHMFIDDDSIKLEREMNEIDKYGVSCLNILQKNPTSLQVDLQIFNSEWSTVQYLDLQYGWNRISLEPSNYIGSMDKTRVLENEFDGRINNESSEFFKIPTLNSWLHSSRRLGTNIAPLSTASSSSVDLGYSPELAIDGNFGTYASTADVSPWWNLSLPTSNTGYVLHSITIYTVSGLENNMLNFKLQVFLRGGVYANPVYDSTVIAGGPDTSVAASSYVFDMENIAPYLSGDEIHISEPSAQVTISEVEVIATLPEQLLSMGTITQSSTQRAETGPEKALDLITGTCAITQTQSETDPWWKWEFGEEIVITDVMVHNTNTKCGLEEDLFTYDGNLDMVVSLYRGGVEVYNSFAAFVNAKDGAQDTSTVTNRFYFLVAQSYAGGIAADSINIQLEGASRVLSMTEVQVFGVPLSSTAPSVSPSPTISMSPSIKPSSLPTFSPSSKPSSFPTPSPSSNPSATGSSVPSSKPSSKPSSFPTSSPSSTPSITGSGVPSSKPSSKPSSLPTPSPSSSPSATGSGVPSTTPSSKPSSFPTSSPSFSPSATGSGVPSSKPSSKPSSLPTPSPSFSPSATGSGVPSSKPSSKPSSLPTPSPSSSPSITGSYVPSSEPSSKPSSLPTPSSSFSPSITGSYVPSSEPSSKPSSFPTPSPSLSPSMIGSGVPSSKPSSTPSMTGSYVPSSNPSSKPSSFPTPSPSLSPSMTESGVPSTTPSLKLSDKPSNSPTLAHSASPTLECFDISPNGNKWHDADGEAYDCDFYSIGANCDTYGNLSPNYGLTASQACCACGGGSGTMSPTLSPTESPSKKPSLVPSLFPTSSPSVSPTVEPTSLSSSNPSGLSSSSPTITIKPSHIPTESPTSSSSPSLEHSNFPTLSDAPSKRFSSPPSLSLSPSFIHSSLPSSTAPPTESPSWRPTYGLGTTRPTVTGYRSIFDGRPCTDDPSCMSLSCKNGLCQASSIIASVTSLNGEENERSLTYLQSWGDNFENSGGVSSEDQNKLCLYGQTREIFELNEVIPITSDTTLRLDLSQNSDVSGVGVCLYKNESSAWDLTPFYCFSLNGTPLELYNKNIMIHPRYDFVLNEIKNIALRKESKQSSDFSLASKSNLAVDGNVDALFHLDSWETNSVTQTLSEKNPWWEVDLKISSRIEAISIIKRSDKYGDDLRDFTITIYKENGRTIFTNSYDSFAGNKFTIPIDNIIGQRVRITLNGDGKRILSLTEVEIFGAALNYEIPLRGFVPSGKTISHMMFVQDHFSPMEKAACIENLVFDLRTEQFSSADTWTEIPNHDRNNIQGDGISTMSDNGDFFVIRAKENEIVVHHGGLIASYIETSGKLRSLAVSDAGVVIAGFDEHVNGNVESSHGFVRILHVHKISIGSRNKLIVDPIDQKLWLPGYGTGVDIAASLNVIIVGSPNEQKVYTYSLKADKTIPALGETIRHDSRAGTFGTKVAISNDAQSIAVADPLMTYDNIEVGAVYVYPWIEGSGWGDHVEILYGRDSRGMRNIGLGSLTVHSIEGRVDAHDYNDNVFSFVYKYQCKDVYSEPNAANHNAFFSQCKCISGFKSAKGSIDDILQGEDDHCMICLDTDCGQRPTTSPTTSPTQSLSPSNHPTISLLPTLSPSISKNPSQKPTSSLSSIAPSTSHLPTISPTARPSSYGTIYDGDMCRFNNECASFNCVSNHCKGKTLSIVDHTQSIENNINANLQPFKSDGDGGIVVWDEQTLEIFGNTMRIFKLSSSFICQKNTRLQSTILNEDSANEDNAILKICIYERLNDPNKLKQCVDIDTSLSFMDVELGNLMNHKQTDINFISFERSNATHTENGISLVDLKIESIDLSAIVNIDGSCSDVNSSPVVDTRSETEENIFGRFSSNTCICNTGYVASNGGVELSDLDVCVNCVFSSFCGFEGDVCNSNQDCDQRECQESRCKMNNLNMYVDSGEKIAYGGVDTSFDDIFESFGGVRIETTNSIRSLGQVDRVLHINDAVPIDKYTVLEFRLEIIENPESFMLCFYENEQEVRGEAHIYEDEERCFSPTSSGPINVHLGIMFGFRKAFLGYIKLHQKGQALFDGELVLSDFRFYREGLDAYYFADGQCGVIDPNAIQVFLPNTQESRCACREGFVASNGGILLGKYDTCVSLIGNGYFFDKIGCDWDRECASGICSNGICEQPISISMSSTVSTGSPFNIKIGSQQDLQYGKMGGAVVLPSNSVSIYGITQASFDIEGSFNVTKYTKLKFGVIPNSLGLSTLMCFSTLQSMGRKQEECSSPCMNLQNLPQGKEKEVALGELFFDRNVTVQKISFMQKAKSNDESLREAAFTDKTTVTNLQISDDVDFDLFDKRGVCKDRNAGRIRRNANDDPECICFDGYVSSNAGLSQGIYDTCVKCSDAYCNSPPNRHCGNDFEMSFELVEGITVSKLQLSLASAVSTPADKMNGGTIVQANGKSIQLYGHAWNSFKLQDTYEFDPYSKIQTLITSGSHINIFICFSEKENILETQNSNSFCIQVGRSKFIYSTFFGNMHVDGLRIYRMNLALGKSTDFSSFTFEGRSELAVDGRPETAFKSIREDNPYLEVYLSRTYLINSIVIQKGQKCRDYQLTDMSISILDEEGNIEFHHYYDSHKDILKVETPPTYGSRVKVRLHGQRRILCVGEIDVIEARGEPLRDIEMPIGKFENGTVANYVTFIQESYDDVSLVSDLRLVYGSLN